MSRSVKILAFSGSARKDSVNQRLANAAAVSLRQLGAEVTLVNLAQFDLPLFDEDLEKENGTPEGAVELKALMKSHHGFIIASPEYNSSLTPLLKNAIDWASRPAEGEMGLAAFSGKTASLLSASPGALGGLRGLVHLRAILGSINMLVLPMQVALPSAFSAFNEDGTLLDENNQKKIDALAAEVIGYTSKLLG